jgi:hypothetical protein
MMDPGSALLRSLSGMTAFFEKDERKRDRHDHPHPQSRYRHRL